jgi:hypothetical protein
MDVPASDLPPGSKLNPAISGKTGADAYGDPSHWNSLGENEQSNQSQEFQRNLRDLTIGQMPTTGYGRGENGDAGRSPDTHSSSNRPTPNSSNTSEPRQNLQPGQAASGRTSYETSPASSHQSRVATTVSQPQRPLSAFFASQPDFTNVPSTGLSPDSNFAMPETPGRDYPVPPGWEMAQQGTGLTPVGEGVFRQLMGLGPADPMDLESWENASS